MSQQRKCDQLLSLVRFYGQQSQHPTVFQQLSAVPPTRKERATIQNYVAQAPQDIRAAGQKAQDAIHSDRKRCEIRGHQLFYHAERILLFDMNVARVRNPSRTLLLLCLKGKYTCNFGGRSNCVCKHIMQQNGSGNHVSSDLTEGALSFTTHPIVTDAVAFVVRPGRQ